MKRTAIIMLAKRLFLALSILMLGAAPAQAVILSNNLETDYASAAGAELWRVDFNEGTPETLGEANYDGKVDFGTPGAVNGSEVKYIRDDRDGISIMSSNTVSPISGVLDAGTHAFAWDFSDISNDQWVHLFDEGGTLMDTHLAGTSGFFGVVSDEAIYSFQIQTGVPTRGDGPAAASSFPERFFIDNFRANSSAVQAVPEPGTILLLGIGLAGIGASYRRRK